MTTHRGLPRDFGNFAQGPRIIKMKTSLFSESESLELLVPPAENITTELLGFPVFIVGKNGPADHLRPQNPNIFFVFAGRQEVVAGCSIVAQCAR